MTRPSVMKATTRITPRQRGQTSGSISYTRRMSWAHPRRRAANEGDAESRGGVEIQQSRTERPSIRWVCHLDPRVDQSRVVEAVLSGAVVLGDGGQGVFHKYLTMQSFAAPRRAGETGPDAREAGSCSSGDG